MSLDNHSTSKGNPSVSTLLRLAPYTPNTAWKYVRKGAVWEYIWDLENQCLKICLYRLQNTIEYSRKTFFLSTLTWGELEMLTL